MTRLDNKRPARPSKTSRRSLTGRVSFKTGGSEHFDSSLERDWLLQLDFDVDVMEVQVQPFTLRYLVDGRKRVYTPDVMATFLFPSGLVKTVVYEVKPIDELRTHWATYKARFKAAIHHCRLNGWQFKIVTEKHIRTTLLENVKFLRKYKKTDILNITRRQLLYTFKALGPTTPQALLAAAYGTTEARFHGLWVLWSLVHEGVIHADLREKLTMSSRITLVERL